MCLDHVWQDIEKHRALNDGRHLPASTDAYHQTTADSCPIARKVPITCPCQEHKLGSMYPRKLGPVLLIALPGNVSAWINEILSTFGDNGGMFDVKLSRRTIAYQKAKCQC